MKSRVAKHRQIELVNDEVGVTKTYDRFPLKWSDEQARLTHDMLIAQAKLAIYKASKLEYLYLG